MSGLHIWSDVKTDGITHTGGSGGVWKGNTAGDDVYSEDNVKADGTYISGSPDRADHRSVWGHDVITLQSEEVYANSIYAGQGNDRIILEAHPNNPDKHLSRGNFIVGDVYHTYGNEPHIGDDTILIKGDSKGNTIFGDTRDTVFSAKSTPVLGNDRVEILGNSEGETYYGDAYIAVAGTECGDDIYRVHGNSTGSTLIGDAEYMNAGSKGGDDTIWIGGNSSGETIFGDGRSTLADNIVMGNDLIRIDGNLSGATMRGDSEGSGSNVHFGNDIIQVGGNVTDSAIRADSESSGANATYGHDIVQIGGNVSNTSIRGDSESTGSDAKLGNDIISIGGSVTGGSIQGDTEGSGLRAVYGNDTISIGGNLSGVDFRGDSESTGDNAKLGSDVISVGGVVTGGTLYGDSATTGSNAEMGNDIITVGGLKGSSTTDRTSAVISGDVYSSGAGAVTFGSDTIHVKGDLTTATIRGDAYDGASGARYGNDVIKVDGTMSGKAVIVGDNETGSEAKDQYGNDFIEVKRFEGGEIYGDDMETTHLGSGGNDTIVIHELAGTESKLIDGGKGTDLFMYTSERDGLGSVINLNDRGEVSIEGVSAQSNSRIIGFEGIGGGSGDDTLTGNASGNTIIGGAGNDTMTGGAGSDIFIWRSEDMNGDAPYTDIITDFSIGEDTLVLNGILDDGASLDDYISISQDGANACLTIKGGNNEVVQNVILQNVYSDQGNTSEVDAEILKSIILNQV